MAENRFTGTLPADITQMPSLRELYAVPHELLSAATLPLLFARRNVTFNLFVGDVSTIVQVNSTCVRVTPRQRASHA